MRTGKILRARHLPALAIAAMLGTGCNQSEPGQYHVIDKSTHAVTQESVQSEKNDGATVDSPDNVTPGPPSPLDDSPVSALAPVNVIDGASVAMLLKVAPGEPLATNTVELASSSSPTTTPATASPKVVELLIPDKAFQRDAASKAWRVSYDDLDLLKVLNLDPVTIDAVDLMPAWLKDLNGQRVRLRGFMFPTFEAEGIERFVLARDNQICCFGRDPKLYDLVQVDMRHGKTTDYIPATRAFDVIGKFKIHMDSVEGKPFGLYYIEDAEIIDR